MCWFISYLVFILMGFVHNGNGMPSDWPDSCRRVPIIARLDWGARAAVAVDYGDIPSPNVVIHHSVTQECSTKESCSNIVHTIQKFHMDEMEFPDIGYNFLIGGDGNVYEGAGWHKVGAHTRGYNSRSVGIGFIGNFSNKSPNAKMLEALKNFLQCGVSLGELDKNYKLFGARQVSATESPGLKLYNELKKMPHFVANP